MTWSCCAASAPAFHGPARPGRRPSFAPTPGRHGRRAGGLPSAQPPPRGRRSLAASLRGPGRGRRRGALVPRWQSRWRRSRSPHRCWHRLGGDTPSSSTRSWSHGAPAAGRTYVLASADVRRVCAGADATACGTLDGGAETLATLAVKPSSVLLPRDGSPAVVVGQNTVFAIAVNLAQPVTTPGPEPSPAATTEPVPSPSASGESTSPPVGSPAPSDLPASPDPGATDPGPWPTPLCRPSPATPA
jgi:hypothetical protein